MKDDDDEPTTWDRQKLVLARQYDLADSTRPLRVRDPVVTSILNLTLVSFILTHPEVTAEASDRWIVAVFLTLISAFGCVILLQVQAQYRDITKRILHLYDQMGIGGEKFFPRTLENPFTTGTAMFAAAYGAMIFTGAVCITAIFNAPGSP